MAEERAQEESRSTRTQQESRENAAAGGRRTPSTYVDMCSSTEVYYCFILTFFTADSLMTKDYRLLHETLQSMMPEKEFVTAQT